MSTAIVVGGGIAGIFSALLLRQRYDKVYLLEQESKIGGLLNSFQNEHGDWFDYGTHFIAGTNVPTIDDLVLNPAWLPSWSCFENEKGGNYFGGELSESCLFIDAKLIGSDYFQGLSQLLEIVNYASGGENTPYQNLEQQLTASYGAVFTQQLFTPALTKLFGVNSLAELSCDAHLRFGMRRIRALNAEATEQLKKVDCYDDRLAFHEFSTGAASRHQYYPKEGGAGRWVERLQQALLDAGVDIICNASIAKIHHQDEKIHGIELTDGSALNCDFMVWTAPLFFLFRAAGIPCKTAPPVLRKTTLFHYVFDRPPIANDHFFFCYDPTWSPFRVTLYSNLQPDVAAESSRHRITVEVLGSNDLDIDVAKLAVIEELKSMGIIEPASQCLYASGAAVAQGFPVLSPEFEAAKQFQMDLAKSSFNNLFLAGKSCSDAWFMHEVYTQIHQGLTNV